MGIEQSSRWLVSPFIYFLAVIFEATIVASKTTARKYSPRTLWQLSTTSFCAALVYVRSIVTYAKWEPIGFM